MQSTGANPQEDAGPPPSTNPQEYYKHLSLFWTDLLYLMSSKPQALSSTGPMRTMAANSKRVTSELSLIHISEPTRPY